MSSERKHRHVLDELLARSVQVPRAVDRRPAPRADAEAAPGSWDEPVDHEDTPTVWAPPPRGAAADSEAGAAERPGGRREGRGTVEVAGEADAVESRQAGRSPIIRDGRGPERPTERRPARSQEEVQVGRGPLAAHLSRAATEERLSETGERLNRTERSLREARVRLADSERHLDEARERLAQTEGRLAEARKHVLASEERLAMTEESERHAREEQARAEEARQAVVAQLPLLQEREKALAAELRAEREARVQAELELARLRGSLGLLSPIVSGIEQATSAIGREVAEHEGRPVIDAAPAAVPQSPAERPAERPMEPAPEMPRPPLAPQAAVPQPSPSVPASAPQGTPGTQGPRPAPSPPERGPASSAWSAPPSWSDQPRPSGPVRAVEDAGEGPRGPEGRSRDRG